MPRIFVAFGDKHNPKKADVVTIKKGKEKIKVVDVPKRLATSGFSTIKKAMAQYPSTKWSVALYNMKASAANICQAIADIRKIEKDDEFGVKEFHVTSSGRCMAD